MNTKSFDKYTNLYWDNIWFISDTHFDHKNCIPKTERPYKDIEEMNYSLISNWNNTVGKDDLVYFLGDFTLKKSKRRKEILSQLNGTKIMIRGNHDHKVDTKEGWYAVEDDILTFITTPCTPKTPIVLHHYAKRVWDRSHYKGLHLYGHSHGNLPGNSQSLDVGVDSWNYHPVSLEQIIERMKSLPPYEVI